MIHRMDTPTLLKIVADHLSALEASRPSQPTLLEMVVARLSTMKGATLFDLAEKTGISYDSLLRMRDGKVDPSYSKVEALAAHFQLVGYTPEQRVA